MGAKTAILLGATGLVGGECLRALLESPEYGSVVALGRRAPAVAHPKLRAQVVDFGKLEESAALFGGDDLFYCLGTTLSRAGSREAFRRVDFEYPLAVARLARAHGASRWVMITSVGASARSPFFYLRVKGLAERAIAEVGFAECHFFRPSLLLGKRPESRPLEEASIPVARALAPLLCGPLRRYRPVAAEQVARAMVAAAQAGGAGSRVHYL